MQISNVLRTTSNRVIWLLKSVFRLFGVGVTSYSNLVHLNQLETNVNLREKTLNRSLYDLEFIRAVSAPNKEAVIHLLDKSKSQLRQDLFVLIETNYKQGGYFVEFGAADGFNLSNTYLLESEFLWKGILGEPAKIWETELYQNRPNASIETYCIWKDSDSNLIFNETVVPELSTVDSFSLEDGHGNTRSRGRKYQVQTISLNDLLKKYNAPRYIDYLSIDTEGSEYEILSAFNFDEYTFGIITVEHNYSSQRNKIFELLTRHGYVRKYETISGFDDWYIKAEDVN
jgi:FkbM family methyltransferase